MIKNYLRLLPFLVQPFIFVLTNIFHAVFFPRAFRLYVRFAEGFIFFHCFDNWENVGHDLGMDITYL
jgi:hypothetical protein